MLYSVYGKPFGLVVGSLAELHSCVLEISPFFVILYIYFGNKGHVISTLARRFRRSFYEFAVSPTFSKIIWTNPEFCAC